MGGAGAEGCDSAVKILGRVAIMPFWIEGWIEVNKLESVEEDGWVGFVNIGSIVDGSDEVSEHLFGLSKQAVSDSTSIPAFAARRGIPSNLSTLARASLESIAEHEKQYGAGECSGYTHMTWREVKAANLRSVAVEQSQWSLLFDLLRQLEQSGRFSDDRIRFVVWFNW